MSKDRGIGVIGYQDVVQCSYVGSKRASRRSAAMFSKPTYGAQPSRRSLSELHVIRHLGHWRRVHARLGEALEIVLVHRLHFGGRGPHAAELREFLEARFSQSF
jgi:hypothetical protein